MNFITVIVIITIMISGSVLFMSYYDFNNSNSENSQIENMLNNKTVIYNSTGLGKNIVDYRIKQYNNNTIVNTNLENILKEKQNLVRKFLIGPENKENIIIPLQHLTINSEWKALEIGVEPKFLIEKNIPTYFETIRNVTGNEINVVLVPGIEAWPIN